MTYHDIALKHGTDKATHGYMPYYEKVLGDLMDRTNSTISKILEIGCEKGNSLRMWRELFTDCDLVTIDLFEEYSIPAGVMTTGVDTIFLKGSQSDPEVLRRARILGSYDLIVDDGSHNSRDQLISFYGLYGCTALYVVEDLHCCKDEFYRQGMTFSQTMLGQMKNNNFPFKFTLFDDKIAFIYG